MAKEKPKNRDMFTKLCFIHFLNQILDVLGIDEEIEDTLSTEYITHNKGERFKIIGSLLDFVAITESGKIIIFEFKKDALRKKDIKQVYDYYRQVYCKERTDVAAIIIVISKHGNIGDYTELDITYHPKIIKTKSINKQEDLKTIREKLKHDIILTHKECSLLVALPLFELNETESEITEEMCGYIKDKKHCIPQNKMEEICMAMYLNIKEYVKIEKQEKLLEMLEMTDIKAKGDFAKLRQQDREEGREEERRNIILKLLETTSIDVISKMLDKDPKEIEKIIQ